MLLSFLLIAATPLGAVGQTAASIELGYPRVPRVAVTFAVHPRFRVSAAGSLDLGRFSYATSAALSPAGGVSIPMQLSALNADKLEWTFSFEPGAFLAVAASTGFGLQLNVGSELKGRVSDAIALGVAIDVPLSLLIIPRVFVNAPVLVGPTFYAQVSATVRLFVRAQAGPGLTPLLAQGVGPYFALLATAGASFAL